MKRFLQLIMMCVPAALMAQNGVTMSGLAVDAGTVTFNVSWDKNNANMPALWSDTVWVFVDYNKAGKMERLPLASGATLTATSAPGVGKVMEIPGNNNGVWVVGNARNSGSFSATVQLLTGITNMGGACVYGSNYPPVGEYISAAEISFTGTPEYNIVLKHSDGSTVTVQSNKNYYLQPDDALLSFSDKTGAPGIFKCIPMTGNINFSAPADAAKGESLSFVVTENPSMPAAAAVTYTWSAPSFTPNSFTGAYNMAYTSTAPAAQGAYSVTLTVRGAGYCDKSVTKKINIVNCYPTASATLSVSAMEFCSGTSVTFALSNTTSGRIYRLYKDGTAVMNAITGTGAAATFTGAFAGAGVYTARVTMEGAYCGAGMTGTHTIIGYPAITAGAITTASTLTELDTNPGVTIQSEQAAAGGSGTLTYMWVRTGTGSPATLTGSNTTYAINSDASNYTIGGTHTINRYAKDAACSNAAWFAAAGTYTLGIKTSGTHQPQGSCTFTQPPVVGIFASFDENYSASTYITLTDERDNKNYAIVKVGNWWVMAQNLNYQKSLTWQESASSPSTQYQVYNTSAGMYTGCTTCIGHFWCPGGYSTASSVSTRASCDVWGALYTWETAMMVDGKWSDDNRNSSTWSNVVPYATITVTGNADNRGKGARNHGICPANWHVPTDSEWGQILNTMESNGGSPTHNINTGNRGIDAGSRGKSSCVVPGSLTSGDTYVNDMQANWYYNASAVGTDNYGFRVLPAGYRNYNGSNFNNRGYSTRLWSSSANYGYYAWYREYNYSSFSVSRNYHYSSYGQSVRCVKSPKAETPVINVSSPTIDASKQLCKDADVTFSIASPVSGATYTWLGDPGTPSGTGNTIYTVVPATAPGTINVSAYAVVPIGGATYQSPLAEAYALVIPPPVITGQPVSKTVCRGKIIQFMVVSSTASSYQWRLNGSAISGATALSYTAAAITANGTYSAVVANRCGSVTTTDILIDVNATMMNFTAFNPTGGEPVGTTWCLVDMRESSYGNSQTYTVRKMPDNRIWMVNNMKFGYKCTKTSFQITYGSNPASNKLTDISGYPYGDCASPTNTSYPIQTFFYDESAVTQESGAYLGSTTKYFYTGSEGPNMLKGICPVGWHIPSQAEFIVADKAFVNYSALKNYSVWRPGALFDGELGNIVYAYASELPATSSTYGPGYGDMALMTSTFGDGCNMYKMLTWEIRNDIALYPSSVCAGNYGSYYMSGVRCIKD
jgi:uncharacterized protein (TIGR02145 family)